MEGLNRLTDKLETASKVDAHNTREVLEALGARVPVVIQINTKQVKKPRKCRLCGRTSCCQECRKTQRYGRHERQGEDSTGN
jgi:hypothetical protein